MESVAGFAWNQWQLSHGMAGSFTVESVAGFVWKRWQACHGISGRLRVESVAAFAWNTQTSGYSAQSHTENVFSRYQQAFGGRLRVKRDASQEREASLACALLNRMRELGRPQSYAVSEKEASMGAMQALLDSCNKPA